uniref:C2 domain-containing protein n=1 Tax=Gadus morhua TaxID=8049 RepID=A0A8C5C1T0_GADMO
QNMFGKKKAPMPKGHGAAAAKKMGLFVDMSPEEMLMGMDDNLDDPSLEAELAAITGDKPPAGGRAKPKGKDTFITNIKIGSNLPKALETMLTAVTKGRSVNEADVPPPVSTGAPQSQGPAPPRPADPQHAPADQQGEPSKEEECSSSTLSSLSSPVAEAKTPTGQYNSVMGFPADHLFTLIFISHFFAFALCLVPAAAQAAGPPTAPPTAPRDVLEALEQRRAKYAEASAQAKAGGDDRKARMHDRIAKQYQSAIRTHKAGKPVNFEELPTPPGFPPIPGQKGAGADQGLAAALETANQLATTDPADVDEDGEEVGQHSVSAVLPHPSLGHPRQLDFLEGRRKQYMRAALQAKQKKDLEQAKGFLRSAKALEPLIEAARAGNPVDISKVPSPPGDEDEDFILVHHSDVQLSEKAEEVYAQLLKILKEQHEKCRTYSKQFTHLGNITETTKFEKMAESCKKNLEILRLSQARGLDPPKHHFEERTHRTVRIFPELSSTEMVVELVKGLNLPAPSGKPNDLDAYVKFDFPYPSTEKPQSHKTAVIKNNNSPEYNQSFTLTINRNHRGFRRVLQSKGLKLEVLHKGGFLRSDKAVGSAVVKLEQLESQSEIREIVEVMDGRKHTGGRIEVKVRLREPLSGQDLQTSTERWLVLDQSQVTPPPPPPPGPGSSATP